MLYSVAAIEICIAIGIKIIYIVEINDCRKFDILLCFHMAT